MAGWPQNGGYRVGQAWGNDPQKIDPKQKGGAPPRKQPPILHLKPYEMNWSDFDEDEAPGISFRAQVFASISVHFASCRIRGAAPLLSPQKRPRGVSQGGGGREGHGSFKGGEGFGHLPWTLRGPPRDPRACF